MRWLLRIGLVTLATIVLLVVAVLLAGPKLLDLPAVKSEAERKLSQAVSGRIAWDTLRIRLLLLPHVEVRGLTIDVPGQAHARIDQAEARLRLRSLLHGQVEVTALGVVRPVVRIEIPPPAPSESEPTVDPLVLYRSLIGPLLQALRNAAPDGMLDIAEGNLELHAPGMPDVQLRGLSLRARADARGVNVEASAASNLWDHLNFLGRIEFADLSGHFGLEVVDLKAQEWLDRALSGATLGIQIPRADLRARFVTDARTDLHCDLGLDMASMQVTRAGQRLSISDSALSGKAFLRAQEIELKFSDLRLGSLFPGGRATLHMTPDAEKPRIALDIPRLDAGNVRDAVLALAADDAGVRRHAPRVRGGEITDLRLRAEADTWRGLLGLDHLVASATLAHGSIVLPAIEQEATELRGRIELSNGKLEFGPASARLGLSNLTDARLRFSLRDNAVSASTGFDLDFPQALAFVRQVLPQDRRVALNEIAGVAGRLRGRADFASASATWDTSIEISRSDASVRIRSLPWPLSLHAARASISPGQLSVSGLQGAVGRSNFSDVGATLGLGSEPQVTSGSGP